MQSDIRGVLVLSSMSGYFLWYKYEEIFLSAKFLFASQSLTFNLLSIYLSFIKYIFIKCNGIKSRRLENYS